MSKKLFRMTLTRKLILEDIATTVRLKREHYQKGNAAFGRIEGFARSMTECFKDEQNKLEKIREYDELEAKYQLCWEVIWITMCHNDYFIINRHCNGGWPRFEQYKDLPWGERHEKLVEKDERGWYNEWDIPLDIFNRGINDSIELLEGYQERLSQDYSEQLKLLKKLRDFRNQ